MALDPIVSLSVALAEAPGFCACLLGAGVSVDAGVPTGWAIYRDGLQRHYRLEHETADAATDEQLDAWLEQTGRKDLGYFTYLAGELRSGDIAVRGSQAYANWAAQLLGWEDCKALLGEFCAQAGLPTSAQAFTDALRAKLAG